MVAKLWSVSAFRSLAIVVAFAPLVGCVASLVGFRCSVDYWDVHVISIEVDGSAKDADVGDERTLWGTTGLLSDQAGGRLDFLSTDGHIGWVFLDLEPG